MISHLSEMARHLHEHPAGLHYKEIAHRIGRTPRHVLRLRDQFPEVFGIHLEEHRFNPEVPRGYLRLPRGGLGVQVTLSAAEVEALLTAAKRLRSLTPLAEEALGKLARGTPLAPKLEQEPVLYSPLTDQYAPEIYEKVCKAIRDRRVVRLTYRNAKGEAKTYRFDPYALIARDPHLYLVGANHNSRAAGFDPIKELRLDQVQSLTLERERFNKPQFDVREYCKRHFRAFGGEGEAVRVRVRFSPEKAGFIRRTRRHPTQVVEDLEDGSAIWQVVVPLSEDLVHFIVGYGPHARVLEPEGLRERVLDWARGVLASHADIPSRDMV